MLLMMVCFYIGIILWLVLYFFVLYGAYVLSFCFIFVSRKDWYRYVMEKEFFIPVCKLTR